MRHADGDPDIKILNNLNNVGAIEVNAFQSQADVCMQKSIREGFGLTVTEALWKGRPMIAGDVGGIPLQIEDGVSGYLVSSPEEAAQRTHRRCSRTPSWPSGSARRARSTRASTSSPLACCATGCGCSPSTTSGSFLDKPSAACSIARMRREALRGHLTYSNVVATIALFIALGGASYAAINLPKNSVTKKQIAEDAVRASRGGPRLG